MASGQQSSPVILDVGAKTARQVLLGGGLAGGIGLLALISSVTGQITGGPTAVVIGVVIGLVFTGIGVLSLAMWRKAARPRTLVLEPLGMRWDDPQGTSWAVRWEELACVAISRTRERAVQPSDMVARRVLVRLDLFPADPGFRQRHPEMEPLWESHTVRDGYRLPLGQAPDFIPLIEEGMRRFRPRIYGGVRDEGFTVGLR